MKIYISGAIHNQPTGSGGGRGEDGFRNVASLVSQLGHIPVVPHDIPPNHSSHMAPGQDGAELSCPPAYSPSAACYMRGDLIEMLANCDAVLMIGEWQHSVGAQREHCVACWTGMPIFYDARELPDNRPMAFRPKTIEEVVEAFATAARKIAREKIRKEAISEQWGVEESLELSDHTRELVDSLGEQERQAMRENAVGLHDEPRCEHIPKTEKTGNCFYMNCPNSYEPTGQGPTKADAWYREAYNRGYDNGKSEHAPDYDKDVKFAEEVRQYGHHLVEDERDDYDQAEVKDVINKIAAYMLGERQ